MVALNSFNIKEIDSSFLDEYSEFDSYQVLNKSPLIYTVSKKEKNVGFLAFEDGYGYQSTITTAALISKDGTLINVKVYEENETLGYMYKINNSLFFSNFSDKSIADGFSIYTNIDAVTGATVTTKLITDNVQKSAVHIGGRYLDISVPKIYQGKIAGTTEIVLIIMLFLAFFASKTANMKLRLLVRIYSLIILGFWLAQFITFSALTSIISLDFPNFINNLRWYILVVGGLLLILLTGKNLYCAYICPFGCLQDIEFRIAKLNYFTLNSKVAKILSFIPGIIAYAALILALSTSHITVTNYEPFSLIFGRIGTGAQWLILPIALIGALFIKNFYCRFGCPVGFMLNQTIKLRRKGVNFFGKRTKK